MDKLKQPLADKIVEQPKTEEEMLDTQYAAKDFHKKIFSFTKEEMEELKPLENVTQLINTFFSIGQIVERIKDTVVTGRVVPRFGIKDSPDVKVSYFLDKNRIIIYEPRIWCSQCDKRRAEYKYKDKTYCLQCINEKKKELGETTEAPKKEVTAN